MRFRLFTGLSTGLLKSCNCLYVLFTYVGMVCKHGAHPYEHGLVDRRTYSTVASNTFDGPLKYAPSDVHHHCTALRNLST
jgi:hypothetical protein